MIIEVLPHSMRLIESINLDDTPQHEISTSGASSVKSNHYSVFMACKNELILILDEFSKIVDETFILLKYGN